MATSPASTRNGVFAAALAAAALLPACGQATTIQQREGKPVTTTTDAPGAQQAAAGQAALDKGDFAAANAAFDQAIAAIGDSHVDPKSMDDTGMQLVLANSKANKGDLATAAKLKAQIVKARLAQAARAR